MVNATALASVVGNVITSFGADGTYYAPKTSPTYSDEGDVTTLWQTTTSAIKLVESGTRYSQTIEEIGAYRLGENEVYVRSTLTPAMRGKIISGSISWEIVGTEPLRVKGTTIATVLKLRSLLN